MTATNPLLLRWGRELDNWPRIKLRMAAAQLNNLGCDVDIWNYEHPIVATPQVSEDRLIVELRITEYQAPPVVHWAALLGNAIAGMRAAADSFAWQLAHLDGREPPNPSQVYFPTAEKQKEWKDKVQGLGDLPDDLLRRFADLRDLDEGKWLSCIATMAALNNTDKHRSSLQIIPDFSRVSIEDLEISFPQDRGELSFNFDPRLDLQDAKLGDVIARWNFSGPILGAKGVAFGTVAPLLAYGPVQSVSRTMHEAVVYALEYLRSGNPNNGTTE